MSGQTSNLVMVLSGPTASGKSALGLEIASQLPAVLINADSMQLYEGLACLTASPASDDFARASHRLYHHFPYDFQGNSVALWQEMALKEIERAHECRHLPIILGGTGFYLKTLIQGICDIPPVSPTAKETFLKQMEPVSTPDLYHRLQQVDPALATTLSPGDRQRICRGLLVYQATEKSLSTWQQETSSPLPYPFVHINFAPPRDVLRDQIQRRFETGWDTMVEEVKSFLKRPGATSSPLVQAAGFKEIEAHIKGHLKEAEAKNRAITRIQQYAKRQTTWFRHQLPKDLSIETPDPKKALSELMSFLGNHL